MSSTASSSADRRGAWGLTLAFAALFALPLVGWGVFRVWTAMIQDVRASRRAAQFWPIAPCRAYAQAQTAYRASDWDGDGKLTYAPHFPLLNSTPDGTGAPISLIDGAFAAATSPASPKQGYCFREMRTIAGAPIDWEQDFALCGTPAIYGKTGIGTCIVSTEGTVYGKDLGRSAFVDDFPADPKAEGWIVVD
ncbi:MAG TPA: DUF2950 family protein [Planctomycetota bacterium]|nr:DUF2950 family protein [Planctomycetota bacterium]